MALRPGKEDADVFDSDPSVSRPVPDRTLDLASSDTLQANPAVEASVPAEGARIGRFVVEHELGRGGMSTVVAAHDPTLGRRVAIKLLHGNVTGTGSHGLLREAQALARLAHPNVVAIHEIGTAGETVFIAMEYVDGETLREWMARPHAWREIVDVFVQAGRGLAAAHAAGLVHRDFKPENVLIRGDGRVQVTDFGLARIAGPPSSDLRPPHVSGDPPLEQALTRTGALVGTPGYMSPEQHDRSPVGPASDQFSFCVALYEALFGSRPFSAPDYVTLAAQVTSGAMRPIPSNTGVPARVRDTITRGLRRVPSDRFPSMTALLETLELAAPSRRAAWVVAAGGLLIAGAVLAFALAGTATEPPCAATGRPLAGAWDLGARVAIARTFGATGRPGDGLAFEAVAASLDRYAARLTAARIEACEATHVHRTQPATVLDLRNACLDRRTTELAAYTATLSRGYAGAELDRLVQGATLLPRIEDCADVEWLRTTSPAADWTIRALVEQLHGRLAAAQNLVLAGDYAEATKTARAVVDESVALRNPALRAAALQMLGISQEEAGDPRAAEESFRAALRAAAEAGDQRMTARLWARLIGNIGSVQSRVDDAMALRESAELAITAAGEDPIAAGQLYNAVGNLHAVAGDLKASRRDLERALAIREQTFGPDHADVAAVLNNLGLTLIDLGDIAAARSAAERAARIYEASYGRDHPDTSMALDTLGMTYWAQGRLDEARKWMEQALARRRRALGEDNLAVARSRNNLGNVLLELGDADAALPHFTHAIGRFTAILGPDHPDVAGMHANLALVHVKRQRWEDALRESDAAVRGFEKALGVDNPAVAYGLAPLGSAYIGLGRAREAIAPLQRAVKLREKSPPHELAATRFELAKALVAAKQDRAGALEQARAARALFAEQGESRAREIAEIDAWLAARR